MIKEVIMKVLRMTKKGYHAKSNPELDKIVTKWNETFEATRVARQGISAAALAAALANDEFKKADQEWHDYEKKNGTPK